MKITGPDADIDNIRPGFILCPMKSPIQSTKVFDAQVKILEQPTGCSIICSGYTCVLHIHSVVEDCRITKLIALIGALVLAPVERWRWH